MLEEVQLKELLNKPERSMEGYAEEGFDMSLQVRVGHGQQEEWKINTGKYREKTCRYKCMDRVLGT